MEDGRWEEERQHDAPMGGGELASSSSGSLLRRGLHNVCPGTNRNAFAGRM